MVSETAHLITPPLFPLSDLIAGILFGVWCSGSSSGCGQYKSSLRAFYTLCSYCSGLSKLLLCIGCCAKPSKKHLYKAPILHHVHANKRLRCNLVTGSSAGQLPPRTSRCILRTKDLSRICERSRQRF
ncbi:hypothetical protein GQ43DRAFT_219260 [Delitschia confertaspora ATCC 74209]|uniref:Uncharacterized protein n=1 Tax=Delitschia confertaspora ATCC 74209 TaxID=1513339 RepID=A0A9P4MNK3_9PLEO|nr:hypothetical protein GQ43DRAFT_219260 [Delitschia confertaspora ATCC 74209]